MIAHARSLIEAVRARFAPDARLAIFEIQVAEAAGELLFLGSSSVPAATEALHREIAALSPGIAIRDEVVRLPSEAVAGRPFAQVRSAIAPMLAAPLISAASISQALFGHRLRLLREEGHWLQCQSGDGYLGWVHRGYLHRASELEARGWESGAQGATYYSLGSRLLDRRGRTLMELPWGARVGIREGRAILPEGAVVRVEGRLIARAAMASRFPPIGEALVVTARAWSGAPYLWGGTTPWGVDCSGFVQAIFRTHGTELPRDSDLQARFGRELRPGERLRPGDLLFFAEERDRITHVAISMGGTVLIHSSIGNGGVRIDDLADGRPYTRELASLLVCVRRLLRTEA